MIRGVFSVTLVSGAILAACSGGGGSTGSGTTSSSGVDSFAAQYCDLFAPCCARASKGYDQTKCTAVLTALAGTRQYDPARGQQCVDAARAESAGATFCDEGVSDATDAICEKVLAANGTKAPGTTCENDDECAASSEGDVSCTTFFENNATKRICQVDLRGKENDDCTATRDGNTTFGSSSGPPTPRRTVCFTSDGLYCHGTTKKCARVQTVGGACEGFSSHACDKSSYCDNTTKMCVAKKPAGADCTSSPSGQCAERHYCDDTTKKCTAQTAVGGPCAKNAQCANGSCTNGKCTGSSLSTALFCTQ